MQCVLILTERLEYRGVPPYLSGGQERTQGPRVVIGAHFVLLHKTPQTNFLTKSTGKTNIGRKTTVSEPQ